MKHEIRKRKADHIRMCTHAAYDVESSTHYLSEVHILHQALPNLSLDEISMQLSFCGRDLSLPLFILPMTGGTKRGRQLNRELVAGAQESRIAVGIGSMRILLENPEYIHDFLFRQQGPDVALIANIGAVQLRDYGSAAVEELAKRLEVDAISVHLNVVQEYFQRSGARDFRQLHDAIKHLVDNSSFPIIVKETGFGIHAGEVARLQALGVPYVDVSGSGGTNWARVEGYRNAMRRPAAFAFSEWGIPLALALLSTSDMSGIIASGGVRDGMDLAKCLVLGAEIVGMALPFIRAVHAHGKEGVISLVADIGDTLKAVMLASGSKDIASLAASPHWISPFLKEMFHEYQHVVK